METEKTLNSQSSLEGKKWSWRNQAPRLQTLLQSYSNQDSMVLAQKQKNRSMDKIESPEKKHMDSKRGKGHGEWDELGDWD